MARLSLLPLLFAAMLLLCATFALAQSSEQAAPLVTSPMPAIPDPNASAADLERQGDDLRVEKRYLDSIDFYNAAVSKQPSAMVWNKEGMAYLMLQEPEKAAKCFDKAIKLDKHAPEGYNNRAWVYYKKGNYNKAIKVYLKAIKLRPSDAVLHYNVANVYFVKHIYSEAAQEYKTAFTLDPDIFQRVSRTGFMAQGTSPEDRGAFSFLVAKIYAQAGDVDRSLEYLRKAMEDGYKNIKNVYTDSEFATLRTDKRFEDLMAQRPQGIQ